MQPLTFIYDPAGKRMHASSVLLLVPVSVFVAWLILFYGVAEAREGLRTAAAILLVPVFAAQWLSLRPPPLNVEDRLIIDSEGLSVRRGGRERRWHWPEISNLRRFGYLHPAGLAVGPVIAFRAPAEDRHFGLVSLLYRVLFIGRNVAVSGHYLCATDDILSQITRYRDQALGNVPPPAPAATPPEPAVYHRRTKPGERKRWLIAAAHYLLGGLLPLIVLAGIAVLITGAWPRDWASLKALFSQNSLVQLLIVVMPLVIAMNGLQLLARSARNGNLLLLSSAGLYLRINGFSRRWLWPEISAPELRRLEQAGVADEHGETISFVACHDGNRPGAETEGRLLPASVSQAIEDIYEAPLGEIARHARAWHAVADGGTALAAAPAAPEAPAPGTEVLNFCRRWRFEKSVVAATTFAAMWVVMIGALVAALFMRDPEISRNMKLVLGFVAFLFGFAAPLYLVFLMVSSGNNMLRLDLDGLTYVRLGRAAGWAWRDIAPFELSAGSSRWSKRQVPLITATLRAGDDRLSRFMRWAYGIAAPRPLTVIEDVYDTPPGEILRLLNEYRERALASVAIR